MGLPTDVLDAREQAGYQKELSAEFSNWASQEQKAPGDFRSFRSWFRKVSNEKYHPDKYQDEKKKEWASAMQEALNSLYATFKETKTVDVGSAKAFPRPDNMNRVAGFIQRSFLQAVGWSQKSASYLWDVFSRKPEKTPK